MHKRPSWCAPFKTNYLAAREKAYRDMVRTNGRFVFGNVVKAKRLRIFEVMSTVLDTGYAFQFFDAGKLWPRELEGVNLEKLYEASLQVAVEQGTSESRQGDTAVNTLALAETGPANVDSNVSDAGTAEDMAAPAETNPGNVDSGVSEAGTAESMPVLEETRLTNVDSNVSDADTTEDIAAPAEPSPANVDSNVSEADSVGTSPDPTLNEPWETNELHDLTDDLFAESLAYPYARYSAIVLEMMGETYWYEPVSNGLPADATDECSTTPRTVEWDVVVPAWDYYNASY
jgi:hypothetical protein